MGQTHKGIRYLHYLIVFLFFSGTIFIQSQVTAENVKTEKIQMVYFYISVCDNCNEAEKTINEVYDMVKASGRDLEPEMYLYNIESKQNFELFQQYADEYDVPDSNRHAPIVFVGDNYFSGKEQIEEGLRNELLKEYIPDTKILKPNINGSIERITEKFLDFTMFSIFAAGLISGFNPCSLSMLLLLVSMLLSKKSNIMKMGLAFCTGKFITYLLLGTVLFGILSNLHGRLFDILSKAILMAFALGISILCIADYFAVKNESYDKIKNQLPLYLRKFNHAWIQKVTSVNSSKILFILCFVLGIVISIGEFLCTGQIYVATIAYMIQNYGEFKLQAFSYLLVYDIAFILPLTVITVAIEKGKAVFDVSEMLRKALPAIKLVTAILFIVFAIIVIF